MAHKEAIAFMSAWYDERTNAYLEWCYGDVTDVAQDLGRAADLKAGMRVLDIGCNTGTTSSYIARKFGCYVVGVDASRAAIEVAQVRAQEDPPSTPAVFHVADAREMPFEDEEFDAVVSKDTFVNIVDRPRLIAEIHRVLKPGGGLAFCDWMQGNPESTQAFLTWREFKKEEPFEMYSMEGYEALLKKTGFSSIARVDRHDELQERISERYRAFVEADPEEMQRRFGIDNHAYFVERFGLTLEVLMARDVIWGHMAARKREVS